MKKVYNKHIGAYGVLIRNGKIVLISKARGGYLGKLDLPGGGIEHKETPEEALCREVMEEAGLKVLKCQLLDVVTNNLIWKMTKDTIEDLHHFGILYTIKTKGVLKKESDGIDSNGAKWYKINELHEDEVTPFTLYSLEKLGYKLSKK